MNEYAIYKGEKCIAIGTVKELAKELKVKESTIRWYSTNASKRRNKGNKRIAVLLENED